jgi:hypothetical protein
LLHNQSAPHLLGGFHDRVQLSPHFVFTEHFRVQAAEAALGADGELLQRYVTRCLIDAAFDAVSGFYELDRL